MKKLIIPLITFVFLGFSLFPIYWLFTSSLKSLQDILQRPPQFFPHHITIDNFLSVLNEENLFIYIYNSTFVAIVSTLISISIGVLSGYGFARFKFPMNNFFYLFILFMRMIPFTSLIIPFFLLMSNVRLIDTPYAVILTHLTFQLPFAVWMMTSFFRDMPKDYEEAAWLDGCSINKALFKIVLPIASPAIVSTAIFCFIWSWNEFAFAVALTHSIKSKTLPIKIYEFINPFYIKWGAMFATGVISSIPVLIFSLLTQKYYKRGLALSLKG
jgi:multiple sugar transport system permease protein